VTNPRLRAEILRILAERLAIAFQQETQVGGAIADLNHQLLPRSKKESMETKQEVSEGLRKRAADFLGSSSSPE